MTTAAARGRGIGGHHRPNHGETVEWLTPPEIIRALGPFDLDPCTPPEMPWTTAAERYTVEDDGLIKEWTGRCILNPPYNSSTPLWLAKLAEHGDGIAVIFARTETAMFFRWVWGAADAVLFVEGRLHFHRPDGMRAKANAGGPTCLVAYGKRNVEALERSGIAGHLVRIERGGAA